MAIGDDFTIYPFSKAVRHTSGNTVYSAVAFYSYLMDTFDEPGFLSYETPIRFNTSESFTMINGWFLDNGDGSNILQYLTGGSIDTSGYWTVTDKVYMQDIDDMQADFVATDKDKIIQDDASNVGPLLAYLNDYPSANLSRIWVRDTNTHGVVADNSAITVSSGAGSGDATAASKTGDETYTNLYTIASFPSTATADASPQVYIYQDHPVTGTRTRISEWSAFSNFDRGSIDVLVPVKLGGSLIDSGNVTSFVRQSGDTFTFVESDLSGGARTPIATETAADTVNITVGEHLLLYDGSNTGSFETGDVITDVPIGGTAATPPSWYAEVVSVEQFTGGTRGVLTLRGLRGSVTDNDTIYVGFTGEGTANGIPGDTLITYATGTNPTAVGDILTGGTSGAKRVIRGIEVNPATRRLVLQDDPTGVTGASRDPYYIDFDASEAVTGATASFTTAAATTTLISGFNDVTVAHVNGTVTVTIPGGSFETGEVLGYNGGTDTCILIATNSGSTGMTIGNVGTTEPDAADVFVGFSSGATAAVDSGMTDTNTQRFNFSLQSFTADYAVYVQGGSIYNTGRSLTDIYAYLQYYLRDGQSISDRIIYTSDGSSITQVAAEEYIKAKSTYQATKAAPFGTLAGGVFFGAQGVWIEGMQSTDNNNIKLTDDSGSAREPFTSITLTISNTRVDDRVAVFLESGTTTLPDKTQYTSGTGNNTGEVSFRAQGGTTFPNDTPTTGRFVVVNNTSNDQQRYRFTARNQADPATLTLPTAVNGTGDAATSGTTLEDNGTTIANNVEIGDIVVRGTTGGFAYVVSTGPAADTVTTTNLSNSVASGNWAVGDTFTFHGLAHTYGTGDTFFVPYMDAIETAGTDASPGTITVDLTYVIDREIVIEARNVENTLYEIVPFKTTGQITNTGLTQSVIRTTDTVYTP